MYTHKPFTIENKEGIVLVSPTYAMGEGIEGYSIRSVTGNPLAEEVFIPYTKTPDEEWKVLSEIGKANVRKFGWTDTGTLEHAVVKVFNHLNFSEQDVELYRKQMNMVKAQATNLFEQILENVSLNETLLIEQLTEYRVTQFIVQTWENRDNYQYCFNPAWVPPTED